MASPRGFDSATADELRRSEHLRARAETEPLSAWSDLMGGGASLGSFPTRPVPVDDVEVAGSNLGGIGAPSASRAAEDRDGGGADPGALLPPFRCARTRTRLRRTTVGKRATRKKQTRGKKKREENEGVVVPGKTGASGLVTLARDVCLLLLTSFPVASPFSHPSTSTLDASHAHRSATLLALALCAAVLVVAGWVTLAAWRCLTDKLRGMAEDAPYSGGGPPRGRAAAKPREGPGVRRNDPDDIAEEADDDEEGKARRSGRASGVTRDEGSDGESESGDAAEAEEPAGVTLGRAMGSALATLSRSISGGGFGRAAARGAAQEMAAALTAYLEAGNDAAEAFTRTFTTACEDAFESAVGDGAGEGKTRGGVKTKGTESKTAAVVTEKASADDCPTGGSKHSACASSSTSDHDAPVEDAEPIARVSTKGVPGKDQTASTTSAGGWFSSFASGFAVWGSATSTTAAVKETGPEEDAISQRNTPADPLASFAKSFTAASPDTAAHGGESGGLGLMPLLSGGRGGSRVGVGGLGSIMAAAANADERQLRVLECAVRMREVLSSERANDIAEQHLDLSRLTLETQRLNISAIAESNQIQFKANSIAATALEGKQNELHRAALERALHETQAAVADSFYSGLMVVLGTTLAGGWRRATDALAAVVGVCPAPSSLPTSWGSWAWSYVSGGPSPLDYAWCVTKSLIGAAWGALLLMLLGWKLLQYNVVTRFQSAPATVLLMVLGGGCGIVGKSAVESLGGDGQLWLSLWFAYVATAAVTTWRAAWVCKFLSKVGPFGRVAFHVALAGVMPFAVGAIPFEDVFVAFAKGAAERLTNAAMIAKEGAADVMDIIGFGFIYS